MHFRPRASVAAYVTLLLVLVAAAAAAVAMTLGTTRDSQAGAAPFKASAALGAASSTALGAAPAMTALPAASRTRGDWLAAYKASPIRFEPNAGQAEPGVRFVGRGTGYRVLLRDSDVVLRLPRTDGAEERSVRMALRDNLAASAVEGTQAQGTLTNYVWGQDPSKWLIGIPTYPRVTYRQVYPGIDLVVHGTQGVLEYDFVVAAGADPTTIGLNFEGIDGMSLTPSGDLLLHTADGDIVQRAPVLYQEGPEGRTTVPGSYALSESAVRFQVGAYDASRTLVIDPQVTFSTYYGGATDWEMADSVATDSSGNVYVVGTTWSTDFPTSQGAFQGNQPDQDAFAVKMDPNTGSLIYATYLGGLGVDSGLGVAVDGTGNAYVTGATSSTNFPVTDGAFQTVIGSGSDAYVMRLTSLGAPVYSTFLGGSGTDLPRAIAVTEDQQAVVVGDTAASNFPVTQGAFQTTATGVPALHEGFVTKLNAQGTALVFSTYLGGGNGDEDANAVAVDVAGNVYVAGATSSTQFPTTGGAYQEFDPDEGFLTDGFLAKLNASGTDLIFGTYVGGPGVQVLMGVAIDNQGNAYVSGYSTSEGFPTTAGALQEAYGGGGMDAVVAKIGNMGATLVYGTYIGGSGDDWSNGIAVFGGQAFVVGGTRSANFPVHDPIQASHGADGGERDAFVSALNGTGTGFLYSTYLGGTGDDIGASIAVDLEGNVVVAGTAGSTDLTMVTPIQGSNASGGNYDVFVMRIGAVAADPQPGTIQFQSASYQVQENASVRSVTLTRTGGSDGTVSVQYGLSNGTATAGSDYGSASAIVIFGDGETSKTFTVSILDDAIYEGDETLTVSLTNPTGGVTIGSPSQAVITILDNELPPNNLPALTVDSTWRLFYTRRAWTLQVGTFSDSDANDTHTATIDWGDGSGPVAATVDGNADRIIGSHVYADPGTYTVVVRVTDSQGGSDEESFQVTVRRHPRMR